MPLAYLASVSSVRAMLKTSALLIALMFVGCGDPIQTEDLRNQSDETSNVNASDSLGIELSGGGDSEFDPNRDAGFDQLVEDFFDPYNYNPYDKPPEFPEGGQKCRDSIAENTIKIPSDEETGYDDSVHQIQIANIPVILAAGSACSTFFFAYELWTIDTYRWLATNVIAPFPGDQTMKNMAWIAEVGPLDPRWSIDGIAADENNSVVTGMLEYRLQTDDAFRAVLRHYFKEHKLRDWQNYAKAMRLLFRTEPGKHGWQKFWGNLAGKSIGLETIPVADSGNVEIRHFFQNMAKENTGVFLDAAGWLARATANLTCQAHVQTMEITHHIDRKVGTQRAKYKYWTAAQKENWTAYGDRSSKPRCTTERGREAWMAEWDGSPQTSYAKSKWLGECSGMLGHTFDIMANRLPAWWYDVYYFTDKWMPPDGFEYVEWKELLTACQGTGYIAAPACVVLVQKTNQFAVELSKLASDQKSIEDTLKIIRKHQEEFKFEQEEFVPQFARKLVASVNSCDKPMCSDTGFGYHESMLLSSDGLLASKNIATYPIQHSVGPLVTGYHDPALASAEGQRMNYFDDDIGIKIILRNGKKIFGGVDPDSSYYPALNDDNRANGLYFHDRTRAYWTIMGQETDDNCPAAPGLVEPGQSCEGFGVQFNQEEEMHQRDRYPNFVGFVTSTLCGTNRCASPESGGTVMCIATGGNGGNSGGGDPPPPPGDGDSGGAGSGELGGSGGSYGGDSYAPPSSGSDAGDPTGPGGANYPGF